MAASYIAFPKCQELFYLAYIHSFYELWRPFSFRGCWHLCALNNRAKDNGTPIQKGNQCARSRKNVAISPGMGINYHL